MSRKIIIGTRGSDLALWQAHHVESQLNNLGHEVEIKIIKTQGDKIQHLSFDKLEGKGFFTKELEDELLNKFVDLAVHSHKDLETNQPSGLKVACVSEREDPSDLLLVRKESYDPSKNLGVKDNAIIGTSSARRKSLLKAFRTDITIKDLRGNVPTRINKLATEDYDAIVLASAGVKRLGLDLSDFEVVRLEPKEFIPAPAQGVLGLQIRQDDSELESILSALNSAEVAERIYVERKVLNMLDGGCQLPLGVYCTKEDGIFNVWASLEKDGEINRVLLSNEDYKILPEMVISELKKKRLA